MQINIKIILDAVNILKMKQEGKNLIIKRIEIIHKLFDNFQLYRKKIENIKSKNLVNNQIYEEVRRRLGENKKFYDEKISDINSLMKKKVIILKKVQKKFLEIQIYIRRESQNFFGFRKQFANFSITPFILENEYLNRYKMKLNILYIHRSFYCSFVNCLCIPFSCSYFKCGVFLSVFYCGKYTYVIINHQYYPLQNFFIMFN